MSRSRSRSRSRGRSPRRRADDDRSAADIAAEVAQNMQALQAQQARDNEARVRERDRYVGMAMYARVLACLFWLFVRV